MRLYLLIPFCYDERKNLQCFYRNTASGGSIMLWDAKNGSVRIGDTEMYYASFGHGEKNLILIPGLSDGLATVKGKALLLAKPYQLFFDKYTVYMFSRKNRMPAGYSIRDMAEDQAQALRTLGLSRVSVLGVSQGGMIAQYLAADHPDLVEKLVIAVSAPCVNDLMRERLGDWTRMADAGDHKQLMIDTAEHSYSEPYLKTFRKSYPVIGRIGKPSSYERFLVNANAILTFDASGVLDQIRCPVLIIGGENDQIVGVQASYELHEKIRGSELYIYAGLGHGAYEEAKDFNMRVFDFLEGTSAD